MAGYVNPKLAKYGTNPDGSQGTSDNGPVGGNGISFDSFINHPIDTATSLVKSPGFDTAAEGARQAQAYLQQLSQVAWDRQMQGLQGALGSFQGYDALSAQMIPRHGGTSMPGGGPGAPAAVPPSTGPAVEGRTGVSHFGGAGPAYTPSSGPSVEGRSGVNHFSPPDLYSPPSAGPAIEDRSGIGHFSPATPLPPPPPTGSLLPPPPGAPPSLAPPDVTPNIMTMLAAMTRSGRGHF